MRISANPKAKDPQKWELSILGPIVTVATDAGCKCTDHLLPLFTGRKPLCELLLDHVDIVDVAQASTQLGIKPQRFYGRIHFPATAKPGYALVLPDDGPQTQLLLARRVPGNVRGADDRGYFWTHQLIIPEATMVLETGEATPCALVLALDACFDGQDKWFEPSLDLYHPQQRVAGVTTRDHSRLADFSLPNNFGQTLAQIARAAGFQLDEWTSINRGNREPRTNTVVDQIKAMAPSRQLVTAGDVGGVQLPDSEAFAA